MKSRQFLEFIKSRCTVREYKKKLVPSKYVRLVIEAGRWSPSLHNMQPWRFIVIRKQPLIRTIGNTLLNKSQDLLVGFNIITGETARVILKAPVVIVVYSSCELSNRVAKFSEPYFSVTKISEIESISASIENMVLMAHAMGLGMAWLTSPLFFNNEIKSILRIKGFLVAVLTLGYSKQAVSVKKRRPLNEVVKFV